MALPMSSNMATARLSTLFYCERNAPRSVIKLNKSRLSAVWRVLHVPHLRQLWSTVETKQRSVPSRTSLMVAQVLSDIWPVGLCLPNWALIASIELMVGVCLDGHVPQCLLCVYPWKQHWIDGHDTRKIALTSGQLFEMTFVTQNRACWEKDLKACMSERW